MSPFFETYHMPIETTALTTGFDLHDLVARRDLIASNIRQAKQLLDAAEREATSINLLMQGGDGKDSRGGGIAVQSACFPRGRCGGLMSTNGDEDAITEIDARVWDIFLAVSGSYNVMSRADKALWRERLFPEHYLKREIEPVTLAACKGFIAQLHDDKPAMFVSSVCELFRNLSWNYKMNTPHKFGKRLKLTGFPSRGYGLGSATADGIRDLERVMHLLDRKPPPCRTQSVIESIREEHGSFVQAFQHDSSPYFKIRSFKNGNCDIDFKRMDLVLKMNEILAKKHPNALPPNR